MAFQNWWDEYPDEEPIGQPQRAGMPQPIIRRPQAPPAPRDPLAITKDQIDIQQGRGDLQNQPLTREKTILDINDARNRPAEDAEDDEDRRFGRVSSIRQEFNALPQVREFRAIRDSVRQLEQLGTNGSPQADIATLFRFFNAIEPSGIVREGEQAMAQKAAGAVQLAQGYIDQLRAGRSLTPQQREQMIRVSHDLYMPKARSYNEIARQYQQYFKDLGEDPNKHILIALGPERQEARRAEVAQGRQALVPGSQGDVPDGRIQPFAQEHQSRLVEFARTAKSAEELDRFAKQIDPRGVGITNAAEIIEARNRTGQVSADFNAIVNPDAQRRFDEYRREYGEPGAGELFNQGAVLGLGDEATGLGNIGTNAIGALMGTQSFDPGGAYIAGRDSQRMRLDRARERSGYAGTAAEIIGGFASGRPTLGAIGGGGGGRTMWDVPMAQGLGGRMAQGAGAGAVPGASAGAGYAGDESRGQFSPMQGVVGAAGGAAFGGFVGGAVPLAGAAIGRGMDAGKALTGRNPAQSARSLIAGAIGDDLNTPAGVARQMSQAQQNGVPYMLGDSGENVRGLLAASSRSPGPGRTLARDALETRQGGLADRVQGAVERDLGPASNPHEMADALMTEASQKAAPLYQQAYWADGAPRFAQRMQNLLSRPSMGRALNKAMRIAAEEGRDPTSLGFVVDQRGGVSLGRGLSWRSMDYIKRGMDDVVESYRDPTSGRLNLDTEGRAINNTLRNFLSQMDQANPTYAQARRAWAGPTRSKEAMGRGLQALNMTGDDIAHITRDMTPGELEFFRLGVRRSMVERVAAGGDTADVVRTLVGTGKKRAMLTRVFGGRENFGRFVQTLEAEREGFRTFHRATQGSPTAPNLQDDGALAAGIADIGTMGLPIATLGRKAINAAVSKSGDKTKEQVAAILSESDPAELTRLARELQREAARRRAASRQAGKRGLGTGFGASFIGGGNLPDLTGR